MIKRSGHDAEKMHILNTEFDSKILWILKSYEKIIYNQLLEYLSTFKSHQKLKAIFTLGQSAGLLKIHVCSGRDRSGRDHLSTENVPKSNLWFSVVLGFAISSM